MNTKTDDPVETKSCSIEDGDTKKTDDNRQATITTKGNTNEGVPEQEKVKEELRTRSESVNSTFDISLPEEMKNDDTKSAQYLEGMKSGISINLFDVLSAKKKVTVSGVNGSPSIIEVPFLYSLAYEAQPVVNEFLFELTHVSECNQTVGTCPFFWCSNVKKLISHASICTDIQCKECIILRPLLLLHSIQCLKPSCLLPFCNQYRNAWNVFIVNMNGCPAPDLKALFALTTRVLPGFSDPSPFSEGHEFSSAHPISPSPNAIQSAPHSPTEIPSPDLHRVPLPHPPGIPVPNIHPVPHRIHDTGMNLSFLSNPPPTTLANPRRRETPISTHYIECCKCHKKRAVPLSLDENMLPNFECSMNIWDTQYNNCQIPENIQSNYTISLSGRTPHYQREQNEFMARLKMFIKNRNMGTFKQPMLGKREVDLYRLFREVTAYGGCDNVVKKEGTWSRIYKGMDNYSPTETSASFRLKKIYNKFLIEYEREMFNFQSPSTHGGDLYIRDKQSPAVSYPSTPRSPTPSSQNKPFPFPYQDYSQWQPKLQQSLAQSKRYQSTSPLPPQNYPIPSMMSYQVPAPVQPIPYLTVPMQKAYQQNPLYNQVAISQQGYGYYDSNKRFCAVDPSMQSDLQQTTVPTTTALPVQEQPVPGGEDLQALLSLRSISPMPPVSETTGKWESLMSAATETAKQQKNGVNTSEVHI